MIDSPAIEEEESNKTIIESNKSILSLSTEEQRRCQTVDLLRVLQLFFLNIGC